MGIAQRLLEARQNGALLDAREVLPMDAAAAYAVQDATAAALGPVGGWKVGAAGPAAEPSCAPLPASGLLPSGSQVAGRLRGIEVEVALRLGRDIDDPADLPSAIDAVLPVIEVVETRLADWRGSPPLAQLADLQTHGALVLGAPAAVRAADVNLRELMVYLAFDGQPVASARGAHPVGDPWPLLTWLARHCAGRGQPLKAGQIVTTGSCSGLLFAPEGARVEAELTGLGRVSLRF